MPLIKVHAFNGAWRQEEQESLLDTIHKVMVDAFRVPQDDRYQILAEHPRHQFRALDTGLGFTRSDKFLLVEVVSRPRPREYKVLFYENLARALSQECGLAQTDLMVTFILNGDEDWTFGNGEAQFLTGAL